MIYSLVGLLGVIYQLLIPGEYCITPERYILLDANVLAGYYAPQTFNKSSQPAEEKIQNLIDSVRNGCSPHIRLLTPEICVSEVQTVLSKHTRSKWKGKGRKGDDPQAIHGKSYKTIVNKMRMDLHGGNLIESIPLARYHVLAKHLITPVDHHLHLKSKDGKQALKELGGTDQLICGMAIWLTRFLGQDRLYVFTADYRLAKVLEKAKKLKDKQIDSWGIRDVAEKNIGFTWTRTCLPNGIYLPSATEKQLRGIFGSWPLPTNKKSKLKATKKIRSTEIEKLLSLYKAIGIGRDRLPYTQHMTLLTTQFNDATGRELTESEVWKHLIGRLKKGGGKLIRNRS